MSTSQWRLSARLARREVCKRPSRTALVVGLVALPVFCMVAGSVLVRTTDAAHGWTERGWRSGTDLVVAQPFVDPVSLSAALPDGAAVAAVIGADWAPIVAADGVVIRDVAIEDPGDNPPSRTITTARGRLPEPGEVWLSGSLAAQLDVDVGDTVELEHPRGDWAVAGIGRLDADFDRRMMIVPGLPTEQFTDSALEVGTLIDLPGETPDADVAAVGESLRTIVERRASDSAPATRVEWRGEDVRADDVTRSLAWGWVAGAIALAATGIIVAAAFATSARRQLVSVGQLSANGAPERLIRRSLALQGAWSGLAGSLLGAAGAIVAVLLARSSIEEIDGAVLPAYVFAVVDLLVIVGTGTIAATLAALVPARSASRVPVLSALAGRHPLGAVPRRLLPLGAAVFALGVFMLFVGASSDSGSDASAVAAVLGGVMVLAGMCCWSPAAIEAMSRLGATIGRSWRFAGRSLERSRARSAAVVTAIAVTGAIGVSGSALALNIGRDDGDRPRVLPFDAVVLQPAVEVRPKLGPPSADEEEVSGTPLDDSARGQLELILPAASVYPRRVAAWTPAPGSESMGLSIVIADQAAIELYELDADERAALQAEGALLLAPWFDLEGPAIDALSVATSDGEIVVPFAVRDHVRGAMDDPDRNGEVNVVYGVDTLMITEQQARRLGFDIVERGAIVRNGSDLTQRQLDALDRTFAGDEPLADWYRGTDLASVSWFPLHDYRASTPPTASAIQGIAIVGVLVLTLLVVAIGLSLAATESRDERDVLVAVGARPRTMRSLAGTKAVVMTLTGLGLAVPAGLVPTKALTSAFDDPLRVPWLVIAGLILAVPLISGGAAWLASSVAQRVRPVRMSNFSFE
jgi:putative ABC transport system permease protein